jgi:hypothetical protein
MKNASPQREKAEVISLTLECLFGRHRPERKAFDLVSLGRPP